MKLLSYPKNHLEHGIIIIRQTKSKYLRFFFEIFEVTHLDISMLSPFSSRYHYLQNQANC